MIGIGNDVIVSKAALRRLGKIFQETPSTLNSGTLDKMIEIIEADIRDLLQLPYQHPYIEYSHLIYIYEGRLEILKMLKLSSKKE